MTEPEQRWDEQLRAALIEHAQTIETVTPWQPPAQYRRHGRNPWRWLAPLAAAAVIVLITGGVALVRATAGRDSHPGAPSPTAPRPPTSTSCADDECRDTRTPATTLAPSSTPRITTPPTTTARTTTPLGSSPSRMTSPRTTTPSTQTRTTTPSTQTRTTTPSTQVRTTAAPRTPAGSAAQSSATTRTTPATSPSSSASTASCDPGTWETLTVETTGAHGVQYTGQREKAKCGGPDDVNWFPTGPTFAVHITSATRIFVLRSPGTGDEPLPEAQFAQYLTHPYTGLFWVAGPASHPTTLTEQYHP